MKIGLVPMSAKPYHRGHHYLVKSAAAQNDKVMLFVSISDRCRKGEIPIYGNDMQDIFCNSIETILPENVQAVYGGSPVRKVYETLIAAEDQLKLGMPVEDVYTVYSDAEDTALNYTIGRSKKPNAQSPAEKYFPLLYSQGYVVFAAEVNPEMFTRGAGAPNVSGTAMRNRLANQDEKPDFIADLPEDLTDSDKESIYTQLRSRLDESIKTDRSILEAYFRSSKKRPAKGTVEYSSYLEEMMTELQHIKSSYDSRKKTGARYRKEASKIQDAYSELRRLRRKNDKILMSKETMAEVYRAVESGYSVTVNTENLDDFNVRDFLRNFKIK